MITHWIDGLPVPLRAPTDLGWVAPWGRVFTVLADQDSGNLCLGAHDGERLFLKMAGAATSRYEGTIPDAVERLRHAGEAFEQLAHPSLVRLRDRRDLDLGDATGHLLVFEWTDAIPLGRQYDRVHEVRALPQPVRVDLVSQLIAFHAHVAEKGWVPVDLYDGSVMVDPAAGRAVVCDIDLYQRAPLTNTMGRMWGSTRFMAPEEFQLGALLDESTTVFTLGCLAHALLGDSGTKQFTAWEASPRQFEVAERARSTSREDRYASVDELLDAWGRAQR
ncbi:serine/threonine-protein kinase [Aestuariimicrobium kwangyangense]|uniref:serine/threonine-protein kinase n=1 Tax=Aestuariimicrobium kwangyangense TaxID=396389 RepID=UPI0003B76AE8|nr:serine/threonine-protein kinase [Aestuariimicrobium kwangyangense]